MQFTSTEGMSDDAPIHECERLWNLTYLESSVIIEKRAILAQQGD